MSHLYATEKMYCEGCETDVHVEQFLSDDLPACPECGCEELVDPDLRDNAVWLLDQLKVALTIIGGLPHHVLGDKDEVVGICNWFADTEQFVRKLEKKAVRS
jgi:hypothetical protein